MKNVTKIFKGEVSNIDLENYTVEVNVSTVSIDRDREIVDPSSILKRINEYMKHPILLSSHKPHETLRNQIGEALNVNVTPTGVRVKFKYYVNEGNPEADWAWKLVTKGIAAYSIGFTPFDVYQGVDEEYKLKYIDIEIYEISQVLIPSNRDAVQDERLSAEMEILKGFYGKEVENMREPLKDPVVSVEKSGRVLSAKNRERLGKLKEQFISASNELQAFMDEFEIEPIPEDVLPEAKSEQSNIVKFLKLLSTKEA